MKRILFVLPELPVGGVSRAFLDLMDAAPEDGFAITLLLLSRRDEQCHRLPPHVRVIYEESAVEGLRSRVSAALRKLRLPGLFRLAKKLYHKLGPGLTSHRHEDRWDIAVAYSEGAASWYVGNRVEADQKIAFIHTDVAGMDLPVQSGRQIYKSFDRICCVSKQAKSSFDSLFPEFRDRSVVCYNGVNREKLLALAGQACHGFENRGRLRILTVGRLSHEKGVDKVPQLLRMLKEDGLEADWYLVGDGPERKNLEQQSKKLGVSDRLFLLGTLDNPYPCFANCDIYVQPSNYEGYCIALAEARIFHRPCLACDFAGASEQLEDGSTGFITPMDAERMYPRLRQLVQDGELRNSFSKALCQAEGIGDEGGCRQWWQSLLQDE